MMLLVGLLLLGIVYGRDVGCRGARQAISTQSNSQWDYTNPANWGGTCEDGKSQSPINIDLTDLINIELPPIEFHDYNVRGSIQALNNGHTAFSAKTAETDTSTTIDQTGAGIHFVDGAAIYFRWVTRRKGQNGRCGGLGARYVLNQFHFHWSDELQYGSEHTIDEARYPLELHFVHIREDLNETTAPNMPGGMAVVAVFFQESRNGGALFELDRALEGTKVLNQTQNVPYYTPDTLLPKDTSSFFRYNGSLTTPPCSEVVIWSIMSKPNHVTLKQLDILREHLEDTQHLLINNWRPVQPLNGRNVYMVKTPKIQH